MKKIDVCEYPKDLEWEDKVFSMPNIPRGRIGLVNVLIEILKAVENNTTITQKMKFDGSDSQTTLNELCVRLRPMKLVVKNEYGWALTKEAKTFLESKDCDYLAAVLCANIKFLGEILFYLDTPKKSSDLQKIANEQYGLMWKTGSDINSRLLWLRTLGLVDFKEFSLLYSRTNKGEKFLNTIHIYQHIVTDYDKDETMAETDLDVSDWAMALVESSKTINKKATIGYIPGNIKDFDNTIREYIELVNSGVTYENIINYTDKTFGVSQSSLRSFMTTLNNMGLIERKTDILYAQTEIANEWMEKASIIDLLFIFHSKYSFVFELIKCIEEEGKTYKELAAIAKVSNCFEKENIDEIRKRIIFLKTAKLVKNVTVDRFIATKRGKNLLNKVVISESKLSENRREVVEDKKGELEELLTELRISSKDSSNYERLEKNIASAFKYLGFNTKWIGGSGNTDVLIQAPSAPKYSFSVAVDAKSTQTGNVTDNLVDFDTLIEHRNKHKANFSAIVGGNFQNERLIRRAIEHGVVLIDIDSLEKLLLNQMEVPIKVSAYRKIFEQPGLVDLSILDEERKRVIRYGTLLHAVMDCLVDESEDPVTGGLLQDRDIYRSLRNDKRFEYIPTLEEISDMLEFMSSPLIGCVEKTKDGYYAVGSVSDASKIFEFYTKACLLE